MTPAGGPAGWPKKTIYINGPVFSPLRGNRNGWPKNSLFLWPRPEDRPDDLKIACGYFLLLCNKKQLISMAPARGLAGWPKNSLRLFLWRVLGSSLRPEIASALGVARLHWLWSDGFNTSHLSKRPAISVDCRPFSPCAFLKTVASNPLCPPRESCDAALEKFTPLACLRRQLSGRSRKPLRDWGVNWTALCTPILLSRAILLQERALAPVIP